ncbi:unnamed protein product, partial [Mesorhabditis spiculigera]
MDEAWALLGTEAGKALADTIVRTGRSLNGGAVFITQNATDVAGDLAGNIGVKFAFRDQDSDKIKNTLAYFGLEATQQNIDMIRNLENGQCLMQDLYGRIGLVHIDVVFQHLFDCFDTRPHAKEEEQSSGRKRQMCCSVSKITMMKSTGEEEVATPDEQQKLKRSFT